MRVNILLSILLCTCACHYDKSTYNALPSPCEPQVSLSSDPCTVPAKPNASIAAVTPGRYKITLYAEKGSKVGQRTVGTLTLVRALSTDRSPLTNESPNTVDQKEACVFYGWLCADLSGVGAPVVPMKGHPPAWSNDPIHPGVFVRTADYYGVRYPKGTPLLLVATISNHRNGEGGYDGAGIGMFTYEASNEYLSGRWGAWGIYGDGSGVFCATKTE